MGATIVHAFVRGQRSAWIALLCALFVALFVVLAQRGKKASPGRLLGMSALVSVLAAGGILLGTALSIPRLTWRRASTPAYAVEQGLTWRTVRSPFTGLEIAGRPEVAVAGLDSEGQIRLFGLFSAAPLEGLSAAKPTAPLQGAPRVCRIDRDQCVAWPSDWPAPVAISSFTEYVWTPDLIARALAYDPESGLLLHHVDGLRPEDRAVAMAGKGPLLASAKLNTASAWALEVSGKLTNEPSREGPSMLFSVRRIAGERLDAVRLVSVPDGDAFRFSVERATLSLTAAPSAFRWFCRPLMLALVVWFPLVSMALQAAPAWWAARRRKRMQKEEPLSEMPADAATFQERAREEMASRLIGLTTFAIGLALLGPAIVAVAGIVSGR